MPTYEICSQGIIVIIWVTKISGQIIEIIARIELVYKGVRIVLGRHAFFNAGTSRLSLELPPGVLVYNTEFEGDPPSEGAMSNGQVSFEEFLLQLSKNPTAPSEIPEGNLLNDL